MLQKPRPWFRITKLMYLPLALYQLWNAAKFQLFTRICVDNPCRLFVYLARLDTSIELDEITVFADLIYNCYSCKLKLKRLGKKTFLLTINLSYLGFRILDTAAPNKSKATQRILGIQKEVTNADTTQVLNVYFLLKQRESLKDCRNSTLDTESHSWREYLSGSVLAGS